MDFISENDFLATEKKGVLYRVVNGVKKEVSGLPKIYVRGQGGLLDVAIHPDFKSNGIIYFTAAINIEGDNGGNTSGDGACGGDGACTEVTLLGRDGVGERYGFRVICRGGVNTAISGSSTWINPRSSLPAARN